MLGSHVSGKVAVLGCSHHLFVDKAIAEVAESRLRDLILYGI